MISQNEKESLTLEDAQHLEIGRAIRNYYSGKLCTILDVRVPVDKVNSIVQDTLYEVKPLDEYDKESFVIAAPVLFNLYFYALNEEGNRYYSHLINYKNNQINLNGEIEEETKMDKIVISELQVGQRLLVVKDGEIKDIAVKAGDIVSVKKVYKDGRKLSLYIMRNDGDKFVLDHDKLLTAVGVAVVNEFFSTAVDAATEEKVEKSVLKQEVLDMKVEADKVGAVQKAKNIDINLEKYRVKFKKIALAFRNQNATIVLLDDGTKGVAKCDPSHDAYDEYIGVSLAYARAILKQENRNFKEFTRELSGRYKMLNKVKKDVEFQHSEIVRYAEKSIELALASTNK